ncbi:MAG TPA: DUF4845 domain-containing protein [Sedimenticola sp.]|nr:DUF4845 domain-containing protein [Sedimenticola sp.]
MRDRQRGMTGTGWLVVLALIGFFSLLAIKLVPVYLENYSVRTVLASLKEEPLITNKSVREIKRIVERRLKVNGVYDVKSKGLKVRRNSGVTRVEMTYSVRKHMMGNVDVLVSFSEQVRLVAN